MGEKINSFESRFKDLQQCLASELKRQRKISCEKLMNYLTMLPLKIKREGLALIDRMGDSVK